MKSYESSTATLRAILAHPSLQREKIDDTMDAMASAHADAKEIDDAIRMGATIAQVDTGIDDAELEDELIQLAREAEEEQAAEKERKEVEHKEKSSNQELVAPVSSSDSSNTKEQERIAIYA